MKMLGLFFFLAGLLLKGEIAIARDLNLSILLSKTHFQPASPDLSYRLGRSNLTHLIPVNPLVLESVSHPRVSDLVDALLKTILNTSVGSSICNSALKDPEIELQTRVGLSAKALGSLSGDCAKRLVVTSRIGKRSPEKVETNLQKKNYIFIISEETKYFESWTLSDGSTVILVNPESLAVDYLFRTIAHELYVNLEIKSSFPHKEDIGIIPPTELFCPFMVALTEPLLRYSLTSYRAMRFESLILKELGLPFIEMKKENQFSDVIDILNSLRALGLEEKINFERQSRYKALISWLPTCGYLMSLSEQIHVLTKVMVKVGSTEMTGWEYLTTPELSSLVAINIDDKGPRPNIGTGTGPQMKGRSFEAPVNSLIKKDVSLLYQGIPEKLRNGVSEEYRRKLTGPQNQIESLIKSRENMDPKSQRNNGLKIREKKEKIEIIDLDIVD